MTRGASAILGLLAGLLLAGCGPPAVSVPDARDTVLDWMDAVTSPVGERGWEYLGEDVQAEYGDDPSRYVNDPEGVDWSSIDWTLAGQTDQVETWLVNVPVEVEGGFAAVPGFIKDHIGTVWCANGVPAGFYVYVISEDGRPSIGPGAQTGTQEAGRCA